MTSLPTDQETRVRASGELSISFALSAGAGTGKTHVLVQRLTQLLRAGHAPSSIAAITFTRAAANELAERSRDALEEQLEEARTRGHSSLVETLESAVGAYQDLTLTTIHSFCRDLLESEALTAQWAPETEVYIEQADPEDAQLYDRWRMGFDVRHPEWAMLLRTWGTEVNPYGNSATVRGFATCLLENRDLDPCRAPRTSIDFAQAKIDGIACVRRIEAFRARCKNPASCKLYKKTAQIEPFMSRYSHLDEKAFVLAFVECDVPSLGRLGNKKDWDAADKKQLVSEVANLSAWSSKWKTCVGEQLHSVLVADLLEYYVPSVLASRSERAIANASDLLFRARALLSNNSLALKRLRSRYAFVLIDEVQDTDPIQGDIAALLTSAGHAEYGQSRDWYKHGPRPGSLFMVGDPKQSIYRFRRADLAVWRQLQTMIERDGQALDLRQNFRSVPGIVDWIGEAFSKLPGYVPQVAFRPPAEMDPVVLVECDKEVDDVEGLVRYFGHIKRSEARVIDRENGELRVVEDRDLLVLIPSWTHAAKVQDHLSRAGISCVVEGGTSFFERDEIRLLMASLRAMDEPTDSKSIVVMLHGLFGITLGELVKHKQAGGSWSYLSLSHPAGPVGEALRFIRELHSERYRVSLVELIHRLLERTTARVVWSLMERSAGIAANLQKLNMLIRQYETTALSTREVIASLEALEKQGSEDLPWASHGESCARITTYFKAKGLEAPVVALVCANRTKGSVSQAVLRDEDGDRLAAIASAGIAPPSWGEYCEKEKVENDQERRRWMYVAATRARDQLVVFSRPKKSNLLDLDIVNALPDPLTVSVDQHGEWIDLESKTDVSAEDHRHLKVRYYAAKCLEPAEYNEETFVGLDEEIDLALRTKDYGEDWTGIVHARQRKQWIRESARASSRWVSVGYLAMKKVGSFDAHGEGVGVVGGQVVHSVMEHLDWSEDKDSLRASVGDLVRAFQQIWGIDDEKAATCEKIIHRLLDLPIVEDILSAPEVWTEVPFAFERKGSVVSGRIDVCFPTSSDRKHWVVVDWKSNLPAPGTALHNGYKKQLEYYTQAVLKTVTPCERVDAVLAGPYEELGEVDWLTEKLELVEPALVELVQELAALGHEPEVGADMELSEYLVLELSWPNRKIGLGLDLTKKAREALKHEGWDMVCVETHHKAWVDQSREGIFQRLGIQTALTNEEEE